MANYDLFISYADDEKDINNDAKWVNGYLIPELGLPTECIITRDNFGGGLYKIEELESAINQSHYTLLILSPAFFKIDVWSNYSEKLAFTAQVENDSKLLILKLK